MTGALALRPGRTTWTAFYALPTEQDQSLVQILPKTSVMGRIRDRVGDRRGCRHIGVVAPPPINSSSSSTPCGPPGPCVAGPPAWPSPRSETKGGNFRAHPVCRHGDGGECRVACSRGVVGSCPPGVADSGRLVGASVDRRPQLGAKKTARGWLRRMRHLIPARAHLTMVARRRVPTRSHRLPLSMSTTSLTVMTTGLNPVQHPPHGSSAAPERSRGH